MLKSFIGQGYHGTYTPGVIQRNILENPAWYTAYTPYQAEISQGRMEALVNFQTMVCDLTGHGHRQRQHARRGHRRRRGDDAGKRSGEESKSDTIIVAGDCHPQTIEVIQTRAAPLGRGAGGLRARLMGGAHDYFAVLAQYPHRRPDPRPGALRGRRTPKAAAFIVAATCWP